MRRVPCDETAMCSDHSTISSRCRLMVDAIANMHRDIWLWLNPGNMSCSGITNQKDEIAVFVFCFVFFDVFVFFYVVFVYDDVVDDVDFVDDVIDDVVYDDVDDDVVYDDVDDDDVVHYVDDG